ncbi:MAG: tetratricopeptide repeat protein [Oligoflexia bacterium]|nr:tetratricopeptide repeat protein [Oligoflexia bacterium]
MLLFWPPFWKYAFIPDVFMLHVLIVSGFLYFYFQDNDVVVVKFKTKRISKRIITLMILFSLGICNHHTTIFLLPMLAHALIEFVYKRKKEINDFLLPLILLIISNFLMIILLYTVLLTTDNKAITSWGDLSSFKSFLYHILRVDYGTFRLAINEQGNRDHLEVSIFYFKKSFTIFISLILFCFVNEIRKKLLMDRKIIIATISFFLYVLLFFSLCNLSPTGVAQNILLRFFLMPTIIFVYIISYIIKDYSFAHKKFIIANIILIIFILYYNFSYNIRFQNFSSENYLEAWAIDRLQNVPTITANKNTTIVLESADSLLFSLYYVQNIKKIRQDVLVISPLLLFYPWYREKISREYPEIKINGKKLDDSKKLHLEKDLLSINIDRFNFCLSRKIDDITNFKVSFLPLGIFLEKGKGKFFYDYILSNSINKFEKSYDTLVKSDNLFMLKIWSQYSFYFLALGMDYYQQKKISKAIEAFQQALKIVPFAYPAQQNICQIFKETGVKDVSQCLKDLAVMQSKFDMNSIW